MFGAQAVSLHGFPRATADLDLTVDLGDRALHDVIVALRRAGFVSRFADEAFLRAARVVPVVHRASGLPIDLVLAGPGLEQLFLAGAELHRIGAHAIPVIAPAHLVVTKLLAGRAKDLEDVRELLAIHQELPVGEIEGLLAELEAALGQSDLRPRFRQLLREASAKRPRRGRPAPR